MKISKCKCPYWKMGKTCEQISMGFAKTGEVGSGKTANIDAVFYRTNPLLYHKFRNMDIFRPRKLYPLCSP